MPASRAAGKSAAAFRTISEVSDELDVPQHVLRFWEGKFSQVRPLKRGGGRRYYRPEDIDLLRRIRNLLYSEGYTIKGVQRLLREGRGILVPEPFGAGPLDDDGGSPDFDEGFADEGDGAQDLLHDEGPGPVEVSGSDAVHVARLRGDPRAPNGLAFWIVFDELRKGTSLSLVATLEIALRDLR